MTKEVSKFTPQEMTLIAQLGYQQVPINHLKMFFARAEALGLNPQDPSQIALIERKAKNGKSYTLQVGIGGARRTARRIARQEGGTYREGDWLYRGIDQSTGQETEWRDTWNVARMGYPEFAKAFVYRDGEEFSHVVVWDEAKQTYGLGGDLTPMWAAKPTFMLGKNAAAGAFRKAFPEELGDVYLDSENFVEEQPSVSMTATRKPPAGRGLAAIEAAMETTNNKGQAPEDAETVDDAGLEEEVRGILAGYTTPEDVQAFAAELSADSTVPEHIIQLARDRWQELNQQEA